MKSYQDEVKEAADALGSDGCTGVADVYLHCCREHDIHCRTGMTLRGVAISHEEAAERFRRCIQVHSSLRFMSPMSWWRWLAVRYLAPRRR